MQIIPLGTASAIPTRSRHLSALVLTYQGRVLLFDCGEGTQMQLIKAGIRQMRIEAVFVTHFHGDHFYGLFGLLSTLALLKRTHPLTIVGPQGIAALVTGLPGLAPPWLPYEVDFVELAPTMERETVYESADFTVSARPLQHREFTAGFRFEERTRPGTLHVERAEALGLTDRTQFRLLKQGRAVRAGGRTIEPDEVLGPPIRGRSFAYVTDTRPCSSGVWLARDVDLLYHEATFGAEMATRALETGHSTAPEAAQVALDGNAARLILGHFSARYDDPKPLVEQGQAIFPMTEAAEELKTYPIGQQREA